MNKITFFLACIFFILSSCINKKPENIRIKIMGTTDIHGALFPYDLVNEKETTSSLAQVYSYVSEERKNSEEEVILLDNGDILQGYPVVYYSNFEKTETKHICAKVMNFMQYDAATVGNHDIEPGHAVYDKLVSEFTFPWLAANAVKNSDGKPYFKPYAIIQKKGVKVAVLGLVTPAIPKWLPEEIWSGIHFEPMLTSAKKWIKIIEEKEKPDFTVGLFHSGIGKEDYEEHVPEDATLQVAKKVPGIDMIICGHNHKKNITWIENVEKEKVLMINPKSRAHYLAEVTVSLKWDKKNKKYQKQLEPKLIELKNIPASREYMERFSASFKEVEAYVSMPIGKFAKGISIKSAMFGDSPFIDLIHNVQLDASGADISFVAPLSFTAQIDSGELQVRDLFKLYRFENLLYTMQLTGKEIYEYLEYSYRDWFQQMKSANDPMLNITTTEEGSRLTTFFFNYDSAEGINYIVDVSKPYDDRIKITGMSSGEKFDESKTYRVAINSYRGNGGGNHLTKGVGLTKEELALRIVNTTTEDLRYHIMKWIKHRGTIDVFCNENWTVVPESWYNKAKKKEYELLYGDED